MGGVVSAQLDKLNKRLAAIPVAVRKAAQPALIKSGEELAATMRHLAPEDSGDLKRSITVTPPGHATPAYSMQGGSRVAAENQVLVTAGNTKVRYGHIVEFGSTKMAAIPFFWPAYRLKKTRLQNRIKRAIGKAIKEEWTK